MEERPFGKTGMKFPILSFGAQRIVDSHGCTEKEAVQILNYALDHGIKYFDTAWVYSAGQSEERVGLVAKDRRQEMWIATKVRARDRDEATRQIQQSLQRLQTDYVDEIRLHNIWDFAELDKVLGPGGALEAIMKARDEGLVRYISISGHTNPKVQIQALERFEFDTALVAVSVMDHFIYSFAEEFLPVANAKGIGVVGMKVLGLSRLARIYDRALRYTFGLPISTAIVGMESMEQLKKNLAVAESFVPMSGPERLELFRDILPNVTPQNIPWKAEDWDNPVEWKRQ
jgi:aryl-alcohol dehydrogenase-like predicted oxidoreductase